MKDEMLSYWKVAQEKYDVFQPTPEGRATRNKNLADRVDYLEAYCASVNAYRNEPND